MRSREIISRARWIPFLVLLNGGRAPLEFINLQSIINVKEGSPLGTISNLMSGSCHLDRLLNVNIGVECQIFVIVIFFNSGQVLHFWAHSRYYKGALTQKRSFLVICTTFRSDFHVR